MNKILLQIAAELKARPAQIEAAVELLDGGATVPFIARYRKEATDGLDDIQLRELEVRLAYLRELEDRRAAVLASIEEQGKLTPELRASIEAVPTKQELEDLYLPYKPRRRTKAMIAKEAGLEPLADLLFEEPTRVPLDEAAAFVNGEGGFADALAVLDGVRDILSERWAEDPAIVQPLRAWLWDEGLLQSKLREGKNEQDPEVAKFRDYFDYSEPIGRVPSHRALAVFRGRTLEIVDAKLVTPEDVAPANSSSAALSRSPVRAELVEAQRDASTGSARTVGLAPARTGGLDSARAGGSGSARTGGLDSARAGDLGSARTGGLGAARTEGSSSVRTGVAVSVAEGRIALLLGWSHAKRPADDLIRKCIAWAWKVKLSLSVERDLFARLREEAERVAIKVFAENLRDLLLAAPGGKRVVMGLDPGIRTGVKVAVVSDTGKVLDTSTVYPHEPRKDWEGSIHTLARLCAAHGVNLIAIGNGTASRETDKLAAELIKRVQQLAPGTHIEKVVVSEAGASVYSASEFASKELPDLDVSLRGAVSIARRLQDPLAELVKIDPKSIGVGQYQHDVNQGALARTLVAVVEDCVNSVGVDLNTASAPLLSRVSGLSAAVAASVVRWRDTHGAFRNRRQLREVAGLGDKTFEQAAGFLRIRDGDDPLDRSGVHPETYPLVEKIVASVGRPVGDLIGNADVIRKLRPEAFADAAFGAITVKDVLAELEKPGRDPRGDFKVARFNEGVEGISDLQPGMALEGTVSNVAQFGAFVDLGVHQDGLVHVSQLSNKFVNDAREVVKTGDIVKVRVLEVDLARGRISLTMKTESAGAARPADAGDRNAYRPAARGEAQRGGIRAPTGQSAMGGDSAMAAAFAKLKTGR